MSLPAVPRLVIGREDVGELAFLYPVDLLDLDLDGIVVLERGRFMLYPPPLLARGQGAAAKPPPGSGLNQPAIITLRRMAVREPNDRKSGEGV